MPERRFLARLLAAGTLVLVTGAAAMTPAALAQTDGVEVPDDATPEEEPDGPWDASSFDAPLADSDEEPIVREHELSIAGTLRYEKQGPTERIATATVRVVDEPADDDRPDACSLPEPMEVDARPGYDEDADPRTSELRFPADGTTIDVDLPCNGRYLVEAEARLAGADEAAHTLRRSVVVHVLPPAVTDLTVAVDSTARHAAVSFTPVPAEQLPPDALGYVIERAGPADDAGSVGMYEDVATIGIDDEPRVVDDLGTAEAGTYAYRVRTARVGADGPALSSIIDGESEHVSLEGPPRTSTSTTAGAGTAGAGERPRIGTGRSRLPTPSDPVRISPPTTLDTGFEETIDYGDTAPQRDGELAGDEPVAGRSVVRDEGEPLELAVPAAGALVLLGWAGHIVYLNRLARQL